MKIRVLWIEDNARNDLYHLAGPVMIDGRYKLDIAADATEAIDYLSSEPYDAVIVDIRIPPGNDAAWRASAQNVFPNRLGLNLLEYLFGGKKPKENSPSFKHNCRPEKYGVLTVEGLDEIAPNLNSFRISIDNYRQKNTNLRYTALLDLITQIIHKNGR